MLSECHETRINSSLIGRWGRFRLNTGEQSGLQRASGWVLRCLAAATRAGTALALVALATSAHAAGDAAVGRGRFGLCEACHGVRAEGNVNLEAPSLAGREGWYLTRQLENFRAGRRGTVPEDLRGQQMRPMALTLESDQAVQDVVAYVISLPPAPPATTVKGDVAHGKSLYSGTCASCHGETAQGNEGMQAPALKGVSDWYLLRQIKAFRNGWRGTAADDTSGAQMRAMAMALPDDAALNDVVAYIASLEACAVAQWQRSRETVRRASRSSRTGRANSAVSTISTARSMATAVCAHACPPCARAPRQSRSISGATCSSIARCRTIRRSPARIATTRVSVSATVVVAASASRSHAVRPASRRAASSTAARRRCGTSASCSACSGTGAPPRWRSRRRDRCSPRTRWPTRPPG